MKFYLNLKLTDEMFLTSIEAVQSVKNITRRGQFEYETTFYFTFNGKDRLVSRYSYVGIEKVSGNKMSRIFYNDVQDRLQNYRYAYKEQSKRNHVKTFINRLEKQWKLWDHF